MNPLKLIYRSLLFYSRTHVGVTAGCAISTAVLAGALFIGDSVRGSLARIAHLRLGRIHLALDTGNRYFRDDLASRLAGRLHGDAAAVLHVKGMAIREEQDPVRRKQVNQVAVLGIDEAFPGLADSPPDLVLEAGEVAVNEKLAAALGAKIGEDVSLRIFLPDLLSREAPLASRKNRATQRTRLTLKAILTDAHLGRFSLRSDQVGPRNAFVDLAWLQETLDLEHRANLLLVGEAIPADTAASALRKVWTLEDAGLRVRPLEDRDLSQLESERIYLDPVVSRTALGLAPDCIGALTYLVNSITAMSGRSTPYSFMTALSPGACTPVPPGMKEDEIVVNRWLAHQLSIRKGDPVTVAYSALTVAGKFVEKERRFRVRRVVEMDTLAAEKMFVPAFPGLTDVETCTDWDIGITTDPEKLEDRANEAYWEAYRQTPKAFVTLAAGREMWANRYGDLMGVRMRRGDFDRLRGRLDPADLGLAFRPVRNQAMRAATESMDLGQLFLGMSFFLIAASLLLTAMLFVFSVEQRSEEMGVLLAVGFTHCRVRCLFLAEGAVMALVGSLAGVPLGWGFARVLLHGLETTWSGAVAGTALGFHADVSSAVVGGAAAAGVSLLAMGITLWRQARRPVRALVSADFSGVSTGIDENQGGRGPKRILLLAAAGAIVAAAWTLVSGAAIPAGGFFGAGALMLVSGIAGVRMMLARRSRARLTLEGLGVRNAARRPGRAMATAGILASGCFIVLSVSAMKEDLAAGAGDPRSATGGFELFGESSIPVLEDMNAAKDPLIRDVTVFPIRVRDGDDASCLNLNLAPTPTLLGVDAGDLAHRGAFCSPDMWALLDQAVPEGVVPAIIGDSDTAVWKIKKKVDVEHGDLLDYTDERGNRFQVKLVATIPMRLTVFQGRLLISERNFTRLYPSAGGHRMFLVDVPDGKEKEVARFLSRKLEKAGLDLVPALERLGEFYRVESTYLMMFLVLGGLGLLLGTAGMGILVLRNVMERRSELAILQALGYSKRQIVAVVMAEHRFLLGAGLMVGALASAVAILPCASRPGVQMPFGLCALFLLGTGLLSVVWIRLATRLALRAPLVPALRNE